ncbi:DEAD/DEAH box helicase family protein, partial [Escherichia coli]|uniref:DEAD/DEAH box helicase family protein n=2 Tax=Bacteria TaxID=2 RepID=UPI003CF2F1F1
FDGRLSYRKQQARLMNAVYDHFSHEEKNLIIEAETGMGKTIGYLFPASYLATPKNPLIVSTTSILLQNQILAKDIPLVN